MFGTNISMLRKFKSELAKAEGIKCDGIDKLLSIGDKQYTKDNSIVIACIDIGFSRCSVDGKQSMSEYEVFKDGLSVGRFTSDARGIYFRENSFNRARWQYENRKVKKYLKDFIKNSSVAKIAEGKYTLQQSTIR